MSGGQTGVDRGALDAALAAGVDCGGWCPAGCIAEDGTIDSRYPLTPLPSGGYPQRTRQNVQDSDATAILYFGSLAGGTALTAEFCKQYARPCLQIDAAATVPAAAAANIADFIRMHDVRVLNVAGPRASKEPTAHAYAQETIRLLLETDAVNHRR